jgi:hypothetical protein
LDKYVLRKTNYTKVIKEHIPDFLNKKERGTTSWNLSHCINYRKKRKIFYAGLKIYYELYPMISKAIYIFS